MATYDWSVDALNVDMDWLEDQVEEKLRKAGVDFRTAYVGSPESLPAFVAVSYGDNPESLRYPDEAQKEAALKTYAETQQKIKDTLDGKTFGEYMLRFRQHMDGETVFLLGMKTDEGVKKSPADIWLDKYRQ